MSGDTRQTHSTTVRLTLAVLGIGLLASLAVGAIYGLVIDDLPLGVGLGVAFGMSVTAVIGVALNVWGGWARGSSDQGSHQG